jgi:hypothetical protein
MPIATPVPVPSVLSLEIVGFSATYPATLALDIFCDITPIAYSVPLRPLVAIERAEKRLTTESPASGNAQ